MSVFVRLQGIVLRTSCVDIKGPLVGVICRRQNPRSTLSQSRTLTYYFPVRELIDVLSS